MKKTFVDPFCEVVRFGNADVVCTSIGCCDAGGIQFDEDDEACEYRDAACSCSNNEGGNCS